MAYIRQGFEDGNVLHAAELIAMEDGIVANEAEIERLDQKEYVPNASLTEEKFSDELKLKSIKDYVTPQMFGAIGDGVTDDTEALQAAINHCSTQNVMLYIPHGKYKFTSTLYINSNLYIKGDGGRRPDRTSLEYYGAGDAIMWNQEGANIYRAKCDGIAIRGLSEECTAVLHLKKLSESEFTDLYIAGRSTFAHEIDGIVLESCTISTFRSIDVLYATNAFKCIRLTSVWFQNLNCWDIRSAAFHFEDNIEAASISDSWFEHCHYGVNITNANVYTPAQLVMTNVRFVNSSNLTTCPMGEDCVFVRVANEDPTRNLTARITAICCTTYLPKNASCALELPPADKSYNKNNISLIGCAFSCESGGEVAGIRSSTRNNAVFCLANTSWSSAMTQIVGACAYHEITGGSESTLIKSTLTMTLPTISTILNNKAGQMWVDANGNTCGANGSRQYKFAVQGTTKVNDSTAMTVDDLKADFNALLAALREGFAIK